jgi:hypothetical protein
MRSVDVLRLKNMSVALARRDWIFLRWLPIPYSLVILLSYI